MKHLLIVYHTQTGNTERLVDALCAGARDPDVAQAVELRRRRASQAGVRDLLWCDALVLATPENFGYMSGAMKDFLDRVYYPAAGRVESLPYALVISAGNDGEGARRSIERIARGFPLRMVQAPIIVRGSIAAEDLDACHTLGAALAAGLEMGLF